MPLLGFINFTRLLWIVQFPIVNSPTHWLEQSNIWSNLSDNILFLYLPVFFTKLYLFFHFIFSLSLPAALLWVHYIFLYLSNSKFPELNAVSLTVLPKFYKTTNLALVFPSNHFLTYSVTGNISLCKYFSAL